MNHDRISRRELLRAGVGATLAAPLAGVAASTALEAVATAAPAVAATAAAAGAFFTAAELALLDELTEMIIPADEHSGGARAAGVAAYLDRTLAEKDPKIEDYATERDGFKQGLARVDFFVGPDAAITVNEVNTMPGFTPISMYPRAWAVTGVDYPTLLTTLVETALARGTGLR